MDCDKKIANLSRAVLVVKPIFIHSFIQSNIIKCNRVQPNTTKQHQLRTGTKYYVPPEKSEWPGHSALFRSKINPPQPPQQAPPILSFQIVNDKFIKKNGKFIVLFGRYKENYLINKKQYRKDGRYHK